ncbi:MAG: YlxR family protein [Acidimicrobiia bacterium]|nr:YlxR family protein [Acidimicrobiia bacterium]
MTSPQRTCVGCRRTAPSGELLRIVSAPDGTVGAGIGRPGRGAWVCSVGCFEAAVRRGALSRALRRGLAEDEVDALRATLLG